MNILIYFGPQLNPLRGGTERVACMIADYLQAQGNDIKYMASHKVDDASSRDSVFLPDGADAPTPRNIAFVKEYVRSRQIDVIINEGASTDAIFLFSHKHIPDNVKIISHLHFGIVDDVNNFYRTLYYPLCGCGIKCFCINVLKWIKSPYNKWHALRNKRNRYQFMFNHSDRVVVLSQNLKKAFEEFVQISSSEKVVAALNPNLANSKGCVFDEKTNTILYVGRLDYAPKRVDRVLKVWQKLQDRLTDWELVIVGGGPDEERLKTLGQKLALTRITFTGQTDSAPYYAKAKMLLLTSNFEGTPMVINEAISAGVVPVVMNTFADAGLVIENGVNGMLTPAFDIDAMANIVYELASDKGKWKKMSLQAVKTFEEIDNNARLSQWNKLIR